MNLTEYIILFLLVVSAGAGIPVLGDTAMIAAGTLTTELAQHHLLLWLRLPTERLYIAVTHTKPMVYRPPLTAEGTCPRGGGGRSYSAARSRCAICSA